MRILVFGDSITQGFWDTEGGWANRLRRHYDKLSLDTENYEHPVVFNMGVSGDSSKDILARFGAETTARANQDIIIVFAVGVNDSRIKSGINFSEPENYRQNLEDLLSQAQKFTSKILFVGLTPCVEARSNPVSWDSSTAYTEERVLLFNKVLEEFCTERDQEFVPILEAFEAAEQKQELLPDSLHPNDTGHQLIADLVRPALDKLIERAV